MFISYSKFAIILGYCGSVSSVVKYCTSTCILTNKAIKANSIWQHDGVLDTMVCAVECMLDSRCLTFSFSNSEGICRGYSNNVDYYKDMLEEAKDNRVFRTCRAVTLHGTTCKRNQDCRTKDFVCHGGVCLCEPGLYFSPTQDACLQECEEFGVGMDIYKGASIDGYNNKTLQQLTLSNCCDICVREKAFICLTADWNSEERKCLLSQFGYQDVKYSHREHGLPNWYLAQRRCK